MPTWSPFYAPPGAQKANFFHTTSEEWGSFSKTGHLQVRCRCYYCWEYHGM